MSNVRIFLNGCLGHMGHVIVEMCNDYQDIEIVAGGDVRDDFSGAFPVYSCMEDVKEEFDVIIDFSHVSAFEAVTNLSLTRNKPIVMCTTGLSQEQKAKLDDMSKQVGVFFSGNMSLGINVLIRLVNEAAAKLYPDFEIEIVEEHHNRKLDAPSGTALMIADEINETLDHQMDYVYDRQSVRRKRANNEIGIHSIRGGNIVGEHKVMFIGGEEIMTISHSAQTRDVFARGAISAARFMCDKEPGIYSMKELLAD